MAQNVYTIYEMLTLTNGNVGIGTTIPLSQFHVEGAIRGNALTSTTGFIDVTNISLCNVQSINVQELLINSSPLPFYGTVMSNLTEVYASNVYADRLAPYHEVNIDATGSTLSNLNVLSVATLTSDVGHISINTKSLSNVSKLVVSTITSDAAHVSIDNKTLSNVNTLSVANITSDAENIKVWGKSLSNIGTVDALNVQTNKLTSTLLNIDVDGKSLSNLSTVAASNLLVYKLTSLADNLNVDGKTLSNVSLFHGTAAYVTTATLSNLTSDLLNINVSGKSLSNIATVATTNVMTTVLTSVGSNIDVDTKSLSNITSVDALNVRTNVLTSTGQNINVSGKTLSNVDVLSVSKVRTDGASVDFLNTITAQGDLSITGTVFASNLQVVGDFTTMNTTTSNTEQLVVNNAGTGPALKVIQTGVGSQYPIAEFVDNESGMALRIMDTGLIGIGTDSVASRLGVSGGMTVGTPYDLTTAPSNSLIVSGQVGVGVTNPASKVGVSGAVSVGSSYAATAAPTDGLIVAGNVGIGTTTPTMALDILGDTLTRGVMKQLASGTRFIRGIHSADYAAIGNNYIGFTITWANTKTLAADQIYAFKVTAKVLFTSETNAAFTSIESVITPVDATPKPNGLLIGAPQTTSINPNNFKTILMTATRSAANAVSMRVNFNNTLAPASAFLTLEIAAPEELGDFTLAAINGAQ